MNNNRIFNLLLGPLVFGLCYFCIPLSILGSQSANAAVGTVAWMALWWILGPVDLAVTAFLPIVLNSIFQMINMQSLIANYASETILLLLGASILTVSWEETGLDKRIAAKILSLIGSNLRVQVVVWFLLAAILSSILPNAVVCAAIIPIAVSMLKYVGEGDITKSKKGSIILLSIVYAAGVGGLATPLGGAMNLVTVKYIEELNGQEYMYINWIKEFFPIMLILIVSNILFLVFVCHSDDTLGKSKEYFVLEYKKFAKVSFAEKCALGLFILATILSFTRQFYQAYLPGFKPAYVFMFCAICSFLICQRSGERLLTWKKTQQKIVWELMYVFAGGLAAGALINGTGVADAIGKSFSSFDNGIGLITIFVILLFTIILSDITSNTATAAVAIPIVIAVVKGQGADPLPYIYIASIGVNLSYMLPTSIRAIPVGYGLKPSYMLKIGFPITVMVLVVLTFACYMFMRAN